MANITLRIRGPSGAHSLSLSPEAPLDELTAKIAELVSIPKYEQELRVGFPPKPLPASSDVTTLSQLGLTSGESIVVAQRASSSLSPSSAVASGASFISSSATTASSLSNPISNAPRPATSTIPSPVSGTGLASSTGPPTTTATGSANRAFALGAGVTASSKYVEVDGGYLCLRVVPDDNSCLFTSAAMVLAPGREDLRQVVADGIRADPETWSDVVLGRPRDDYISTILRPNSWGGAIELSILSSYFDTEIASIDVQTGRIDRFGQGHGYENVALLVYSGIHYDALTFSYSQPSPSAQYPYPDLEFDTRLFSVLSGQAETMLGAAQKLVDGLRKEHAFTDAANFTLKCQVCGKAIVGEKEARAHASESGHVEFGEYEG